MWRKDSKRDSSCKHCGEVFATDSNENVSGSKPVSKPVSKRVVLKSKVFYSIGEAIASIPLGLGFLYLIMSPIVFATNGESFSLGNINFQLYNTNFFSASLVNSSARGRFDNVNSLCALVTINGRKIYFAGDIGNYYGQNQESIVAKQIGDIDVYKVAHHGYVSFNNHQDALNALHSEYAVVTNNRGTAATAVSRIRKANSSVKVYYTPEGTVTLMVSPSGEITFYQ